MRALTMQGSRFAFEELPRPEPARGQLLVRPLFNGICGSDLHLREQMQEQEERLGGDRSRLPKFVLGHEFSAEVVEVGAGTATELRAGDRIVALPFSPGHDARELVNIGLAPDRPGAMAELILVDAERSFRVPDGVPSELAALTEPLSVGRHAANLADRHDGPNLVIGCGPIGLAVLLALRDQGRGPIVALDLSPERRAMAAELGADLALDPAEHDPYAAATLPGFAAAPPSPLRPRAGEGRAAGLNIFECTGVPAVLQRIVAEAPRHSHVIYTGICMHAVPVTPVLATLRELTVEFSFAYSPREFEQSLDLIARAPERVARLVTGTLPLDRAEAAFERLGGTAREVKLMLDLRSRSGRPVGGDGLEPPTRSV